MSRPVGRADPDDEVVDEPARQGIMSATPLLVAREGAVARVTLNREQAGNAIDLELAQAIRDAAVELAADPSCAVVLLCSTGRVFCAGGDVVSIASAPDPTARLREMAETLHEAVRTLRESPIILVSAVQGSAAGAGFALVLSSDLVVASTASSFLAAYSAVGLTPDTGLSYLLPRLVGERRAMELALLGRRLDAGTAKEWGIVNEVVAEDEVEPRAAEFARLIADGPRTALAETKRLIREGSSNTYTEQLDEEARTIVAAVDSPEARARIGAFVQRRTAAPGWRGR